MSDCANNASGTGEITIGGTTALFWDSNKYYKLIPHHPELKIPTFVAQNAQAKVINSANFPRQQATDPVTLYTSIPVTTIDVNGHEDIHIIPMDDDDVSFHDLPKNNKEL